MKKEDEETGSTILSTEAQRVTELEKAVVRLTTNVDNLSVIAAKSQEQITEQIILQTKILCTFETAQKEIKSLAQGLDTQAGAIINLEHWKIQQDTKSLLKQPWLTAILSIFVGVSVAIIVGNL